MSNENTSLKIATPAADSKTTHEIVIGKNITFQRPLLIVASSLLALLVLVAIAGKSGGQNLLSSAYETDAGAGAGALADYQVDTANYELAKDIFSMGAVSENEEACNCACVDACIIACQHGCTIGSGTPCPCGGCPKTDNNCRDCGACHKGKKGSGRCSACNCPSGACPF